MLVGVRRARRGHQVCAPRRGGWLGTLVALALPPRLCRPLASALRAARAPLGCCCAATLGEPHFLPLRAAWQKRSVRRRSAPPLAAPARRAAPRAGRAPLRPVAGVSNETRDTNTDSSAGLAAWTLANAAVAALLCGAALGAMQLPAFVPFSLTPAEHARGVLMACIIGTRAASQVAWGWLYRTYTLSVGFALAINAANLVFDTIALASACAPGLPALASDAVALAGAELFVAGTLLERVPEAQRAAFKAQPGNKGKPHMGGLIAVARHINYTGYTLWRVGAMLAGRGWLPWSLLPVAGLLFGGFPAEVAAQRERNLAKYGRTGAYADYVRDTKALIPGVW